MLHHLKQPGALLADNHKTLLVLDHDVHDREYAVGLVGGDVDLVAQDPRLVVEKVVVGDVPYELAGARNVVVGVDFLDVDVT